MQKKWLTQQFIGFFVCYHGEHTRNTSVINCCFVLNRFQLTRGVQKGAVEGGTNIMSGPDSGGQVFKIVKKEQIFGRLID